jgi:hypothetical protein
MPTDLKVLTDTIEECYEFTLSYAAKGLPADEGSESGRQLREHLTRAAAALRALEAACDGAVYAADLQPAETYLAFTLVLARDAQSAVAAVDLVLAQPAIGSQLIDNLNASMHLRALLTDLFLFTEVLDTQEARRAHQAAGAAQ